MPLENEWVSHVSTFEENKGCNVFKKGMLP
jgi:hypothetical protein